MKSPIYPDFLPRLGVNIDHIATLRELRNTPYPSVTQAAEIVIQAGADQITVHPREDERHIKTSDVEAVFSVTQKHSIPLNLEMAIYEPIVQFATELKPQWCCLVPEKREEVTTEGGLDLKSSMDRLKEVMPRLKKHSKVSLFVEPEEEVVRVAKELGADALEFHTGRFGIASQKGFKDPALNRQSGSIVSEELEKLSKAALLCRELGMNAHAGHGIDDQNIRMLVDMRDPEGKALLEEYNIGHFIVCRAAIVGLDQAVKEMKAEVLAP